MAARRRAVSALGCAAAIGLALSLTDAIGGGGGPVRTHEVSIEGMVFAPANLTVRRGDTVRWRNKDLVPHTVTAAGRFDSGTLAPNGSWTRTLDVPGRYDYVCAFHPTMKATLVVE